MTNFSKYQGIGNDFIIFNNLENKINLKEISIVKLCDRHFGVGADGVILLETSENADFKMGFFNNDGSQAEMCGNGIRCLAAYIRDNNLISKDELNIETLSGVKKIVLSVSDGINLVKVNMGAPVFNRSLIPMSGLDLEAVNVSVDIGDTSLKVTCLSMGNPHCVIFVEDIDNISIQKLGSLIENLSVFPNKTNVEFVEIKNKKEINLRVWERGVGETLACGTGACASLAAANRNNLTERKAVVHLRGGDLEIDWSGDNNIYMTGPAVHVFNGEIDIEKS